MTDFTKTKLNFALALLGTLFILQPFVGQADNWKMEYRVPEQVLNAGVVQRFWPEPPPVLSVTAFHVMIAVAVLLALSVWCYAVALVSERSTGRSERLGNVTYALAVLAVPLFFVMYLAHWLFTWLGDAFPGLGLQHLVYLPPVATVVLLLVWVAGAWRIRHRLGAQDRFARITQLAHQEMVCLNRAREMLQHDHYDLAVIQAWQAIEARLEQVLMKMRLRPRHRNPEKMIDMALHRRLLTPETKKALQQLREQWNVAVSTVPLTKQAAQSALNTARDILSTIAVEDPRKVRTAARRV
jgi:HEPN domain-containing protein